MPCPHPNIAVRSVVTPIPTQSALQKASSAMHAMATTTLPSCVLKRVEDKTKKQTPQRGFQPKCHTSSHCRHRTSFSPWSHQCRSPSQRSHSRTPSHSLSHSPSHSTSLWHSSQSKRCSAPHRYYQDAIKVIPVDSITTSS